MNERQSNHSPSVRSALDCGAMSKSSTTLEGLISMRFIKSLPLAAVAVTVLAAPALAHPGHSSGLVAGVTHPFTGLDHLLVAIAVGLWASQLGRPALFTLPVVFPAMMAIGAAAGINGVVPPWIEIGIALSVFALGAAVAMQLRLQLVIGAAVVCAVGILHGYAHGAELPAGNSWWPYLIGLIAATSALHGIGIAIGVLGRRPLLMRSIGGTIATVGLFLLVAH